MLSFCTVFPTFSFFHFLSDSSFALFFRYFRKFCALFWFYPRLCSVVLACFPSSFAFLLSPPFLPLFLFFFSFPCFL